jgi:SAM-dependent methyltransferase
MSNSNSPSRPKPTRNSRKSVSASQPESICGFYRAFEERYRGPRDLIKRRLSVYLPFIGPLRQIYPRCTAIDLGCGRGEWLELLERNGFEAYGVDLDDGMLAACRDLGLNVIRQEAIGLLQSLEDNSHCIVSGFHFAEHILFADLRLLFAEALRVLKPGGLLILEMPNPENVVVGTTDFYLDPTHQRPIPPLLLSFLSEYQGFARVKILRLQESHDLADREDISLKDVFFGTSPDYAVVAQKIAGSSILPSFNTAFDKQYGIELGELANRYDARIERRIVALDQRVGNIESSASGMGEAISRISTLQDRLIEANSQIERGQYRATQLTEQLHHAAARATDLEQRALAAEAHAHDQEQRAITAEAHAHDQVQRAITAEAHAHDQEQRAITAEAHAHDQAQRAITAEANNQEQQIRIEEFSGNANKLCLRTTSLEAECYALRQSWSWRITAPARWIGGRVIHSANVIRRWANHLVRLGIKTFQSLLTALIRKILSNPGVSDRLNRQLLRYPVIHNYLLEHARHHGLNPAMPIFSPQPPSSNVVAPHSELKTLTPRALQIYQDLKYAMEKRNEEAS